MSGFCSEHQHDEPECDMCQLKETFVPINTWNLVMGLGEYQERKKKEAEESVGPGLLDTNE